MKGALVTFIAKVEGVAKEKFSAAPPQTPTSLAPPPNKNSWRRYCYRGIEMILKVERPDFNELSKFGDKLGILLICVGYSIIL